MRETLQVLYVGCCDDQRCVIRVRVDFGLGRGFDDVVDVEEEESG